MASTTDIAAEPAPLHKHPYHLVDPSPWPIVGSFAGGALVLGIILLAHYGIHWMLYLGIAGVLATMFFWWRDVLIESRTKLKNRDGFILAAPGLETRRALEISGLDKLFTVHDTVPDALGAKG